MAGVKSKKIVYLPMSADIVHKGHLTIIKAGLKLGEVVVGLLTDEAIASKKRLPIMEYSQRFEVISNIKGVDRVIPQSLSDYRPNLRKLRPDFVVHGDDWSKTARQQVKEALKEWGGQLVEIKYTGGVSSTAIQQKLKSAGVTPMQRLGTLERLLNTKKTIRALEAHNGLSALIVENTHYKNTQGHIEQFDAIWISSLTDSIAKGKPDTEVVDRTSRLATINEILEVTTKPIIVDGDTGGQVAHFVHTVKTLERLGVSAVVIEDKTGLKRNSLHELETDHIQDDARAFAIKIKAGLDARLSEQFMVIARIESLVVGAGQKDALDRAKHYLKAGASAIMIHSKDKSGGDIHKFTAAYNKLPNRKPLMLVPTSYNNLTEDVLADWGANIIVYANHLLRAAFPAMERSALTILSHKRARETEEFIAPIEDFLKMIPGS